MCIGFFCTGGKCGLWKKWVLIFSQVFLESVSSESVFASCLKIIVLMLGVVRSDYYKFGLLCIAAPKREMCLAALQSAESKDAEYASENRTVSAMFQCCALH